MKIEYTYNIPNKDVILNIEMINLRCTVIFIHLKKIVSRQYLIMYLY